ncbi:MAG: AMIN domain-containing protein [Pseudomonadota bacterium]
MAVRLFLSCFLSGDNLIFIRFIQRRSVLATLLLFVFLLGSTAAPASAEIDVVRARISAWCNAWQNRDIDAYMSFYSPAFRSDGLDYLGWGLKKTETFKKPEDITVQIFDLWVLIEGNRAVARFVQQYARTSHKDVGEKILVLGKTNATWKIVSEAWSPLPGYSRLPVRSTGSESVHMPARQVPAVSEREQRNSIEYVRTKPVDVESIKFEIEEQEERVFVDLNRFSTPAVFNIEGSKPRIVIDIMNVASWNGDPFIPVNGRLIRQIRTYLHKGIETLRIVLDLEPSEDYYITQTYYDKDNIYCLQVR